MTSSMVRLRIVQILYVIAEASVDRVSADIFVNVLESSLFALEISFN